MHRAMSSRLTVAAPETKMLCRCSSSGLRRTQPCTTLLAFQYCARQVVEQLRRQRRIPPLTYTSRIRSSHTLKSASASLASSDTEWWVGCAAGCGPPTALTGARKKGRALRLRRWHSSSRPFALQAPHGVPPSQRSFLLRQRTHEWFSMTGSDGGEEGRGTGRALLGIITRHFGVTDRAKADSAPPTTEIRTPDSPSGTPSMRPHSRRLLGGPLSWLSSTLRTGRIRT